MSNGQVDLKEFERVFGFNPQNSSATAPMEQVAVVRRLQQLAQPWGNAHDRLTELRARYEASTDGITHEQAVKDAGEAVKLDGERHRAGVAWEVARNHAKAAGFMVSGDIKAFYQKEGAAAATAASPVK